MPPWKIVSQDEKLSNSSSFRTANVNSHALTGVTPAIIMHCRFSYAGTWELVNLFLRTKNFSYHICYENSKNIKTHFASIIVLTLGNIHNYNIGLLIFRIEIYF